MKKCGKTSKMLPCKTCGMFMRKVGNFMNIFIFLMLHFYTYLLLTNGCCVPKRVMCKDVFDVLVQFVKMWWLAIRCGCNVALCCCNFPQTFAFKVKSRHICVELHSRIIRNFC